ncbi:MAG: c-type cytochrome [Rhodospirillales bacterium]|nr:c-type cytochrome [Rhodospirillales bacterium]
MKPLSAALLFALALLAPALAMAAEDENEGLDPALRYDFVAGVPDQPTTIWGLAYGARLYDNWWQTLGEPPPARTHPAYPAGGARSGAETWRCESCHGWDYRGVQGLKGVTGRYTNNPERMADYLRGEPHRYTADMLPDSALHYLSHWLTHGRHNPDLWIAADGHAKGDVRQGETVYQTMCAACHGYDGRAILMGEDGQSLGRRSKAEPHAAFHKIRNGAPGSTMPALRAFEPQWAANVLAYAQTLPE